MTVSKSSLILSTHPKVFTVFLDGDLDAYLRRRLRVTDGRSGLARRALLRYFALMDHTLYALKPPRPLVEGLAVALYDAWLRGELDPLKWHRHDDVSPASRAAMRRWTHADRAAVLDFLERVWLLGADVLKELD